MRRRPPPSLLAFALPILLLHAPPAAAAVVQEASVEEVARTAESVVRGRVARVASRWSADGRRILTDVELEVAAVWKGGAPPRVRVTVPGGRVGRIGQRVDAAPVFAEGEDVVVFLGRRGASLRVAGLALGKYRVEAGEARPGLEGVRVPWRARPLPSGERAVGAMPVDELERRVRSAR